MTGSLMDRHSSKVALLVRAELDLNSSPGRLPCLLPPPPGTAAHHRFALKGPHFVIRTQMSMSFPGRPNYRPNEILCGGQTHGIPGHLRKQTEEMPLFLRPAGSGVLGSDSETGGWMSPVHVCSRPARCSRRYFCLKNRGVRRPSPASAGQTAMRPCPVGAASRPCTAPSCSHPQGH